jgi:hypothetical protein
MKVFHTDGHRSTQDYRVPRAKEKSDREVHACHHNGLADRIIIAIHFIVGG